VTRVRRPESPPTPSPCSIVRRRLILAHSQRIKIRFTPNNKEGKELVHGLDVVQNGIVVNNVPYFRFCVPRSVLVLYMTITWQGRSSMSSGPCSAKWLAGITRCSGRWRCAPAMTTTQSERYLVYAGPIAVVAPSLLQRRRTRKRNNNKTKDAVEKKGC
jgi:hypothetical protein